MRPSGRPRRSRCLRRSSTRRIRNGAWIGRPDRRTRRRRRSPLPASPRRTPAPTTGRSAPNQRRASSRSPRSCRCRRPAAAAGGAVARRAKRGPQRHLGRVGVLVLGIQSPSSVGSARRGRSMIDAGHQPFSSAVANTNGLKADPGCRLACTARLKRLSSKFRPPTSTRTSPVAASIATSAPWSGACAAAALPSSCPWAARDAPRSRRARRRRDARPIAASRDRLSCRPSGLPDRRARAQISRRAGDALPL